MKSWHKSAVGRPSIDISALRENARERQEAIDLRNATASAGAVQGVLDMHALG